MGQLSVDLSAKMESLKTKTPVRTGISFPRYFTSRLEPGKTPYDDVQWETRTASIGNDKGSVIFEQRDVEAPVDWSQTATNIVASKYFHGKPGSPERETSVEELVHRVVDTIAEWGSDGKYFHTAEDAENFRNELAHLMLTQKACFNSPVFGRSTSMLNLMLGTGSPGSGLSPLLQTGGPRSIQGSLRFQF